MVSIICSKPRHEVRLLNNSEGWIESAIVIWLLHDLVEASFVLFKYILLGDQLKPWELHILVSYELHKYELHADTSEVSVTETLLTL